MTYYLIDRTVIEYQIWGYNPVVEQLLTYKLI